VGSPPNGSFPGLAGPLAKALDHLAARQDAVGAASLRDAVAAPPQDADGSVGDSPATTALGHPRPARWHSRAGPSAIAPAAPAPRTGGRRAAGR
jgi:hypothetical protein